ncbi:branched-chain amino acid ABC transporter ATP-binding protein/permease [Desulfosporosinus fructosivorans]|uniref:Branched-chain amino acid ABC transporter ATP-binding protein/permease n=1 Tax=Desulfosporosinus fructosivorans TaxID=2018669 RepID=A0A4Z0R5E3_9FIRM|nr:branched-chain amino acid ABC transporter ATP-binding protein/permease [Desulfosporosinus fructosivorans]TGE37659.1 branched-chain amino acid ABC transporter ATP-binding protein/permease [Desulfosporosinus fructosivorans]
MKRKFNKEQKILFILGALLLIGFLAGPATGPYFLRLMSLTLIYLILTTGLNIVSGYAGQVSLGQAGLYGIGAYTGGVLSVKLGLSIWLGMPVAMVVAGICGLIVGIPTLRVSGHYLALITIGFGVIVEKLLVEWVPLTGGPGGISVQPISIGSEVLSEVQVYYVILAICLLVLWLVNNIIKSPFGRAFSAIRDNEIAAGCMGINIMGYKLLAFVLSAVFAGLAGCIYTYFSIFVSPDTFSFNLSVFFLLTLIVGGQGTMAGPIIGTILLTILPEYMQALDKYRLIIYGLLLIVSVIGLPHGISGAILRKFPKLLAVEKPEKFEVDPIVDRSQNKDNEDLLVMENVTKRFGGLNAIQNISLTVKKGSVHSLIGPNGAGKSTLINIITGVYKPNEGSVLFNGSQINGTKPYKIALAGISRTFQSVQVFGNMSVLENVMVGGHGQYHSNLFDFIFKLGRGRKEERITRERAWALLQMVGLEDRASEFSSSLSSGQQRLLEIARALAMEPDLLLLDEPAAGLNEVEISHLSNLIKKITPKGVTILLIEHHIDFVMDISNTITVLNFGKKLAEGSPTEIQENQEVIDAYLGKDEAVEAC